MLGKTANGLYWMYRYIERAGSLARLIETGQRISLTHTDTGSNEWHSVLESAGALEGFLLQHDEVTQEAALDWLLRSTENSSSVLCCLSAARHNARIVRTALTPDVWEAINGFYIDIKKRLARKVSDRDLPALLDMLHQKTALVAGATNSTMLRNDLYDFTQLGTFVERGDNTARILDVKYYVLLPSVVSVGSSIDNVQWETILRSLSAHGGFRMQHGNTFTAREITDFLVLDRRMPRSLAFCAAKLCERLEFLSAEYSTFPKSLGLVREITDYYSRHSIDEVFEAGLHEHLQWIIGFFAQLSRQIEIDFRFYE